MGSEARNELIGDRTFPFLLLNDYKIPKYKASVRKVNDRLGEWEESTREDEDEDEEERTRKEDALKSGAKSTTLAQTQKSRDPRANQENISGGPPNVPPVYSFPAPTSFDPPTNLHSSNYTLFQPPRPPPRFVLNF